MNKLGPVATLSEVAVANKLPPKEKLEEMLTHLRFAQTATFGGTENANLVPSPLSCHEFDEMAQKISNLVMTPTGADLLIIILPTLIDACDRGRMEAVRQLTLKE